MSDFWSRRRAQVAAEQQAEAEAREAAVRQAEEARQAEKTDEELLEELGLPDPDSLQMGDDVTPFMRASVPVRLRNRALRRLWRSNPVLACLDGLNDYDDDYTDAACVVENLKTVYQVGKGMLARFEEEAEEQATGGKEEPPVAVAPPMAGAGTPALAEDAGDSPEAVQTAYQVAAGQAVHHAAAGHETEQQSDPEPAPEARPVRRMRFTFDGVGA